METKEFIVLLNIVFSFANVGLKSCRLNEVDHEEVICIFEDGYIKKVNIACDSKLAILKDLIAAVE